jgi:hypothetical protein
MLPTKLGSFGQAVSESKNFLGIEVAFTTWSKDIILCLIAIKTITATKKVLNIIYGFKDNNKQISSQFQFLLGFKISVKTVCLLV